MAIITPRMLDSYLGMHIDSICPKKYVAHNHCAHFVGHVLNLQFGCTCTSGVNVRVQEIFHRCGRVEEVHECRTDFGTPLLFVTGEHNVNMSAQQMSNVPKKHIGIVCGATVWHYSNSHHRVAKELVDHFIYHYRHQHNGLWLGALPAGASPHAYGQ